MKKKPFALLLALCTLFASLAMFSACGDSPTRESANSLTYEKKYIYYKEENLAGTQEYNYYLFHSNNTGEYYYFHKSFSSEYVIKFKYVTIGNESVVCFYDSIEYAESHNGTRKDRTLWREILSISPEVAYDASSKYIYVCETYLKEIPNFGK